MLDITPPPPPKTIEETGLTLNTLLNLVSKIMNERGTTVASEISEDVKLPRMVVRLILKEMTSLLLIESQGLEKADVKSDVRYSLTDRGKKRAAEAMLATHYVGPAPVTLEAFHDQIEKQSITQEVIERGDLQSALSHLVLPEGMLPQLGPAANSGRSILLYGEAGNGKTSIAEAIGKAFKQDIYIPYAITVGNQIIVFYDETLHEVVDFDPEAGDPRWIKVKRPTVVAGGELTLEMLDLLFDQRSRTYEAPMHLKALGGVFVVDDFGRQKPTPLEILNRWIVPLELGFDILSLHTGKKFNVPFDQLVIFSTNLHPQNMGDEATMRRIYFKIFVPSPSKEDYAEIFRIQCEHLKVPFNQEVVDAFFEAHYRDGRIAPSGAHPGFLLTHIKAACVFLHQEPRLTRDMLDLAWKNVAILSKREKITDLSA